MVDRSAGILDQLNQRAWDIAEHAVTMRQELQIRAVSHDSGAMLLDFGVERCGTIAAGIMLARICTAGLAEIQIVKIPNASSPFPHVQIITDHPLAACVGAQYAGWPLAQGDFFAMCSGPARLARGKEELLQAYRLERTAERVVGVLETAQIPHSEVITQFADECGVTPDKVFLCVAQTASFAGAVQVVARSVETTLHKLHELGFDLSLVHNAMGTAPLPPVSPNNLTALGWTNDAILYGSDVNLWVDADNDAIDGIGKSLPSCTSDEYGQPFVRIFERHNWDFYQIDKMLFSPARVCINSLQTGESFVFGRINESVLHQSFGLVNV